MIHYHGTPITPRSVLYELHGRHFCISFADPRDTEICHQIGQSVLIDNGAFSYWKRNKIQDTPQDWNAYYAFIEQWLDYHTTWAVIPDVIGGSEKENDALMFETLRRFPSRRRQLAPVWHIHESTDRLYRLMAGFDRICFGSSDEYAQLNTPNWNNRMNDVFNQICDGTGRPPIWIHMLRGMSLSGSIYPFASVDSTDIARNHEQRPGAARGMAETWDALQCPARWISLPIQQEFSEKA